jgi:hypothetical protein
VARDLRKSNYFFALFWFPQPQVAWRRCDLDGRSTERPGLLCGTTHAAALNDGKSTDQFLLRMTNYGEHTMQLALSRRLIFTLIGVSLPVAAHAADMNETHIYATRAGRPMRPMQSFTMRRYFPVIGIRTPLCHRPRP